jgi:hypothetical protein
MAGLQGSNKEDMTKGIFSASNRLTQGLAQDPRGRKLLNPFGIPTKMV